MYLGGKLTQSDQEKISTYSYMGQLTTGYRKQVQAHSLDVLKPYAVCHFRSGSQQMLCLERFCSCVQHVEMGLWCYFLTRLLDNYTRGMYMKCWFSISFGTKLFFKTKAYFGAKFVFNRSALDQNWWVTFILRDFAIGIGCLSLLMLPNS